LWLHGDLRAGNLLVHAGRLAAVLGEEQLLQRRLPAEELRHPGRGQPLEQRLHRPAHLTSQPVPVDLDFAHTRHL